MKNSAFLKLAFSTVAIAVPTAGCTQFGMDAPSTAARAETVQAKKANGWALKAEKLLAKGQADQALTFAEMAVEGDMRNLEYRGLLARSYVANGRFASAERTLMDVMELGQVDPRTVVSLALARIAQGKVESAISLVEANRAILPASDYGLALALAGDAKRAIAVLTDAIRSDNATARTRQNLALAFAMDGRWREAQVMALQDMPQETVDSHLVKWAQYARPGAYTVRIAGLLGVNPVEDAGQPVRLALNNAAAADVQMAALDPVSVASAEPAPVDMIAELAATGPVPGGESNVVVASVDPSTVIEAEPAPLIRAPVGPTKAAQAEKVEKPVSKPVKLALADVPAVSPSRSVSGSHLVQLGAFSSAANAQKAWSDLTSKHSVLKGFSSASSTVTVKGKKFVRLAAMGFGNAQSANAVCSRIKSSGGVCLVRNISGEAQPVRMARAKSGKKPVRIAAR